MVGSTSYQGGPYEGRPVSVGERSYSSGATAERIRVPVLEGIVAVGVRVKADDTSTGAGNAAIGIVDRIRISGASTPILDLTGAQFLRACELMGLNGGDSAYGGNIPSGGGTAYAYGILPLYVSAEAIPDDVYITVTWGTGWSDGDVSAFVVYAETTFLSRWFAETSAAYTGERRFTFEPGFEFDHLYVEETNGDISSIKVLSGGSEILSMFEQDAVCLSQGVFSDNDLEFDVDKAGYYYLAFQRLVNRPPNTAEVRVTVGGTTARAVTVIANQTLAYGGPGEAVAAERAKAPSAPATTSPKTRQRK